MLWVQFLSNFFMPQSSNCSFLVQLVSFSLLVSSSPLQTHSVPLNSCISFPFASLELLPICLPFSPPQKFSKEWSTCIASTSYLSFLILLQSCFCSQQPDEKTPFKGTVWSLNNRQPRVLFSHWLLHLFLAFEAVNTSLPIFECLFLHPLWCCVVLFPPKVWLWFFLLSLPLLTLWACAISCSFSLIFKLSSFSDHVPENMLCSQKGKILLLCLISPQVFVLFLTLFSLQNSWV